MADILFIAITVAFFVLCVGYVQLCDRIIGGDESAAEPDADLDVEAGEREEVAA
jgi:hypothetical protein